MSKHDVFRDWIIGERIVTFPQDEIGVHTRTHSLPLLMNLSKSMPMSARTKRHM